MSEHIVKIVRIGELEKHPNADTLQITQVDGWWCIVKEGQFAEGDLAIYVPIDSVLPPNLVEDYELEYLKNGARVRTVKLRGFVSQGLLLDLPKGMTVKEGDDVTETLCITKWEPPVPGFQAQLGVKGRKMRSHGDFIKYTNISHAKSHPHLFEEGDPVVVTEKIHGTNFRVGNIPFTSKTWWDKLKSWFRGDSEYVVGSHNCVISATMSKAVGQSWYGRDVYSEIAKRYNLPQILPKGAILFGEIYGKGIQDLTYGRDDIEVVFFDLAIGGVYKDWDVFLRFCTEHNLPMVPVLYRGPYSAKVISDHTDGKSVVCPSQIREGCVIKPLFETNDRRCGRKIVKSVSEKYLLRKGGTEFH